MSDAFPEGGDLSTMAKEGTKVPSKPSMPEATPSAQSKTTKSKAASGGISSSPEELQDEDIVTAVGGEIPEDLGRWGAKAPVSLGPTLRFNVVSTRGRTSSTAEAMELALQIPIALSLSPHLV
ncbi:uncharacterized protein CTHT_0035660 [Thermochaetoides thermophila DSM 1495]|uniref:Uncharacterized protein n=1 Tax=Chaetomium thermophilum (strain DSM 1495 / CBS 144.50 / IMI 039719) TaxID=759272 RepID=G0S702_CHATD|nr:hypothetical protein CTHT_0035660 [Thermochaetoides thermophila DSM 1495]EGS21700.1 hypothetical protein CTHT_0035660 [Thermochaetoides thermophila DSM 1495]